MRASLLLSLLSAVPALWAAGADEARALLESGKPEQAVALLRGESGPEAAFWRGRAEIALVRPQAAVEELQQVPSDSPLYPYAAKALLWCAWQSPAVDFEAVVSPLAQSPQAEIAHLAQAALAEHALAEGDAETAARYLDSLRGETALAPSVQLMQVDLLRLQGKDEAAELCRRLEGDRSLPSEMRQRARLALAEIYYAQEAALAASKPAPAASDDDDEEDDDTPEAALADAKVASVAKGRGEATLLHFVSSNPESPLLEEALRRLMAHHAFMTSETARTRLREWSEDTRYPRRASLALLLLQRFLSPESVSAAELDASCVNAALASYPREAATRSLLLEQVRRLLHHGDREHARLYLSQLGGQEGARAAFLAAAAEEDDEKAADAFRRVAETAPEELQGPAWYNALLCSLRAGKKLPWREADLPRALQQELEALELTFDPDAHPEQTAEGLRRLLAQQPAEELRRQLVLEAAYQQRVHGQKMPPEVALDLLKPEQLSEEQQLCRAALLEQGSDAVEALRACLKETTSPRVREQLTLRLAYRLSEKGEHREALCLLQDLLRRQPKSEQTPTALFLCARQSEQIPTLGSLKRAIALYGDCAEVAPEGRLRRSAIIRRASVLNRIGQQEEALRLLTNLLRHKDDMYAKEQAFAYATMARAYLSSGTPEGAAKAAEVANTIVELKDLPDEWHVLALLNRGAILTRAGRHAEAVEDYLAVLRNMPKPFVELTEAEQNHRFMAAAGAIFRYLDMDAPEKAVKVAEEAAAWAPTPDSPEEVQTADETTLRAQKKCARFAEWANEIYTENFLSAQE